METGNFAATNVRLNLNAPEISSPYFLCYIDLSILTKLLQHFTVLAGMS